MAAAHSGRGAVHGRYRRARRGRALAAVVLLGAGACTLEPHYVRPALPVASAYPTGPAYTSSAPVQSIAASPPTAGGTPAPELGWRDVLQDPRLQRLVEMALANNRDLRIAVLNVETARAQYGIQRSALLPTLAANGAAARGRGSLSLFEPGSSVKDNYEAYLSVSWTLDFFGRVRSLEKSALENYLATAQARKASEILLISEVANQYLTLLAADEALRVTDGSLGIARESTRIAQLKFDTGSGSELDLREAQGSLEQALAQDSAERRARAQAENALVLLIGAPLPADLPAGLPLQGQHLMLDIPAGLPSELLARRPDVIAAEDQLLAANANIGAARAAFFPAISLTGALGSVSPVLRQLFQSGSGAWGVEPTATLPLFTGGLNSANLEAARAQRGIAVAQYEKTVQTAFREVADGLAARATYEDQAAAEERLVALEERRLALSQMRYKNGVDSYLTLLEAQTDLNNAQLARVNVSLERLTNLVTLYQDLGGGWIERKGDAPRTSDTPP